MSNESREQTLTANLKQVQERYRRRSLESRLEDIAEDLRDIKLQVAIMEELFETEVEVDPELVQKVGEARQHAEKNQYDILEEEIGELEKKASSAKNSVGQSLSKKLVSYEDRVNAMVKINKRIEAYNQDSLNGLHSLLAEWNWREAAGIEEVSEFGTQLEECLAFGSDMQKIYQDAKSSIIEPLAEEGIEDVVESILGSEVVYLGELSAEEREKLADSDLGEHLSIKLG